jgi:DNA mismatch endonuclease, patch repair protein
MPEGTIRQRIDAETVEVTAVPAIEPQGRASELRSTGRCDRRPWRGSAGRKRRNGGHSLRVCLPGKAYAEKFDSHFGQKLDMSDPLSKLSRSELMSKIRARGNRSTEVALKSILLANRITGWRRHLRTLGVSDFAFPKSHLAIFVDGCFWHGCPVCRRREPSTNQDFWRTKIAANILRDRTVRRGLRRKGWLVLGIWEPGPPVNRERAFRARFDGGMRLCNFSTGHRQTPRTKPGRRTA